MSKDCRRLRSNNNRNNNNRNNDRDNNRGWNNSNNGGQQNRNNQNNWNDNPPQQQQQQQNNNNPFNNLQANHIKPEVNLLSLPPIQPYDIVPDIWNAQVNMTVSSLLSTEPNDYGRDLLTAMNTIQNRDLQANEIEPIRTTAMKMKL